MGVTIFGWITVGWTTLTLQQSLEPLEQPLDPLEQPRLEDFLASGSAKAVAFSEKNKINLAINIESISKTYSQSEEGDESESEFHFDWLVLLVYKWNCNW